MSYVQNNRYLLEPQGGANDTLPSREEQVIAYAATIAIATTQEKTIVLIGTLTGALTLTVGTTPGTQGNQSGVFDGDELTIKLPANTSGQTVTFSTGFTTQSTTMVLGVSQVGVICFIYDGATSKWVEQGRNIQLPQVIKTQSPYTAGTDTTAGWTLAAVKTGLIAGIIKSTTVAGVTITLDSIANIITAFAAAGYTLVTGSSVEFILDNSQGANTLTLAVDSGTTITAAKQVSSGDSAVSALLTVAASAGASVGKFSIYITSATTGTLFRLA